jgi:hypothetical protein
LKGTASRTGSSDPETMIRWRRVKSDAAGERTDIGQY